MTVLFYIIWFCRNRNNWFAPGRFESNFECMVFRHSLVIHTSNISYETDLLQMPLNITDDTPTLNQVIADSLAPASDRPLPKHVWLRSRKLYPVTRPNDFRTILALQNGLIWNLIMIYRELQSLNPDNMLLRNVLCHSLQKDAFPQTCKSEITQPKIYFTHV